MSVMMRRISYQKIRKICRKKKLLSPKNLKKTPVLPRPRADFAEIKKTAVYDSKFGPKEAMCKIFKNFVTRSPRYAPSNGRTDERTGLIS